MTSPLRPLVVLLMVLTVLAVTPFARAVPARAAAPARSGAPSASAAPAPSGEAGDEEAEAPFDPAPFPGKVGPAKVELGHDLTLELPAGDVWLNPEKGRELLAKNGSFHNENLLGVVLPADQEADWFVTLRYEAEGFVKDDEKPDSDELLKALREGQEEANRERVEKGFKVLNVDGWSEPPRYDAKAHHLVWGLLVSSENGRSVNYNTRVLGRRGYVSVNLISPPEKLAEYRPVAAGLLSGTTFNPGARYEDFDKKTDKVAEYGLGGLVLVGAGLGAAKLAKVGILAKFGAFFLALFAKAGKLLIVGLAAVAAFLKKVFGRKSQEA